MLIDDDDDDTAEAKIAEGLRETPEKQLFSFGWNYKPLRSFCLNTSIKIHMIHKIHMIGHR